DDGKRIHPNRRRCALAPRYPLREPLHFRTHVLNFMGGLRVSSLSIKTRRQQILNNLSLDLYGTGKSYGLVGINGAGKTTLMQCLAGAWPPTTGSVSIANEKLYRRKTHRVALRHVALMPQHVNFPAALTPHELVSYLCWLRGMNSSDAITASRQVLHRVFLSDVSHIRLAKLSGGMLRRVALAQAVAGRPAVILLDEPSAGLDPEQRQIMLDLLSELDESLVLMSSHRMSDIKQVTQQTLVIHHGS